MDSSKTQAAPREAVDFVQIVEGDTDALVVYDCEFRYRYINAAAEAQLGKSRAELLGSVVWEVFPDTIDTPTYAAQTRAMREQVVLVYEADYAPLGLYFEARAIPYTGPGGGLVVSWHDVSARKRAEQQQAEAEAERARLATELQAATVRQRKFLREMLSSLTEGRLRLCDSPADLPVPLAMSSPNHASLTRPTLRDLRHHVEAVAHEAALPEDRTDDLVTAVGEASMNAVVHAVGGSARVGADLQKGTVQVWISDTGGGISEDRLHRATLDKGYSTAGTLGHGFWMILKTVDRIYLLTGPQGTTIVLEQDRVVPLPAWMQEGLMGDFFKAGQ